jgi:hypothetical protein
MEPYDELERYLQIATILYVGAFDRGGAHPDKRLVVFEGGVGALAKPARAGDAEKTAMVRCEAAAWVLARDLGWHDLVATTILRQVPLESGGEDVEASLQILWPAFETAGERGANASTCHENDRWRIGVFDALCRNTDRNAGNWGFIRGSNAARLLDHGYAFEPWPERAPGSEFVGLAGDDEVPGELRADVENWLAAADGSPLHEILTEDGVSGVQDRAQQIVENATLPTL